MDILKYGTGHRIKSPIANGAPFSLNLSHPDSSRLPKGVVNHFFLRQKHGSPLGQRNFKHSIWKSSFVIQN